MLYFVTYYRAELTLSHSSTLPGFEAPMSKKRTEHIPEFSTRLCRPLRGPSNFSSYCIHDITVSVQGVVTALGPGTHRSGITQLNYYLFTYMPQGLKVNTNTQKVCWAHPRGLYMSLWGVERSYPLRPLLLLRHHYSPAEAMYFKSLEWIAMWPDKCSPVMSCEKHIQLSDDGRSAGETRGEAGSSLTHDKICLARHQTMNNFKVSS